jgi:oligopeptide transport system ATP-binding protein
MNPSGRLVDVTGLTKWFPIRSGLFSRVAGYVKAVNGVSFHIDRGETLGLVGESGCGKTTTGRCIARLIEPSDGKVVFEGREITGLAEREMRRVRSDLQFVFQDPYASLNPRMTVGTIVAEPLIVHRAAGGPQIQARVQELLSVVGLGPEHAGRYPYEFSGGQRQRIGIARALALNPKLIICDEPVSALDVSLRSEIINLLQDLQERFALTYLFISHDLAVVRHICDRVAVMYLGRIVEIAPKRELYDKPGHPYTRALLSAIPLIERRRSKQRILIEGDVPSPVNPPAGCHFHPRCRSAKEICEAQEPPLKEISSGHSVACHLSHD